MTAGAHFQINQASNAIATGTTDTARIDLRQSQVIHFVGDSSSGQASPAWTITAWPDGSARAQPTNRTTFDATYTPDVLGSYAVQYLVGDGVGANAKRFIFAVTQDSAGVVVDDGFREPAFGELVGDDNAGGNDRGYAKAYETGAKKGSFTVATIAALRLVKASRFKRCHVLAYATLGDGGGGAFYWDATSTATDDGGIVIAPTGVATGRWRRQYSGPVNILWYGPSSVGLDVAFNKIFASAAVANGVHIDATGLSGSYATSTTIDQTKSAVVTMGPAVVTSSAAVFWKSNGSNLILRGTLKGDFEIKPANSTTAFKPGGTFPTDRGSIQWELGPGVTITGGADETHRGSGNKGVDFSGTVTNLTEGDIQIHRCEFRFLEYGIIGGASVQNLVVQHNYFYYCDQNIAVGSNAETTIRDNWGATPPDATHAIWDLSGGPKIECYNNNWLRGNLSSVGAAYPDVLIAPTSSQLTGSIVRLWGNHAGGEGENLNDQHIRVQVGSAAYPNNYNFDVQIFDNTFGGCSVGAFTSTNIARDAAGACTATLGAAHGIPIARAVLIGITQSSDVSLNGTFLMTATSTTALSWTQANVTGAAVSGKTGVFSNQSASPIHVVGPQNQLRIHDNKFFFYSKGAKCTQSWTSDPRGYSGNCEWYDNDAYPPNGTVFTDFDGPPLQFTRVEPSVGSSTLPIPKMQARYYGRRNRIIKSEDLTDGVWAVDANATVTGGKLDPRGKPTAFLLTKAAAYSPSYQCVTIQPVVTQLPDRGYLSFWARPRCGSSRSMATNPTAQVAVIENGTTNFLINPLFEMPTPTSWAIASSTNASPIVVTTSASHDYQTGDIAEISGHLVNTNANGEWIVTRVDATHFSLNGSTGNGVGVATGTAWHPQWRYYEFPVTYKSPGGGTGHTITWWPGAYGDAILGDFYIWHPQLADTPGQDYYPNNSTTLEARDATGERRIDGTLQIAGPLQVGRHTELSGGGPTVSGVLGLDTGTIALEANSADGAGVIVLSPTGTPGAVGIPTLVFAETLPDTSPPIIHASLSDGTGGWGNGSCVRGQETGTAGAWTGATFVWGNCSATAAVNLTAGLTYRISYWITRRK